MAGSAGSFVHKSSGTTDESVVTSGRNDDKGLTTLDTGRSITLITLMFVDCEGLASNGSLIDLEESIIGNNAAICGNDGALHKFLLVLTAPFGGRFAYFFDLENVTRNNFRRLDFKESSVTENHSFQGKGLLQLVHNRTGLELLDEADCGVQQEQGTDNTEIDPIFETCSKNSSSLSQHCY
jgi:hypothetical protein